MPEQKEILVSEQTLKVPFCYSAGRVTSRFLVGLRDESVIYGIRCPSCGKIYVPPRSICGECLTKTQEWVELSGEGIVESYTEVQYKETVHPREAPFSIGLIKLDGADTGMVHLLSNEVEIGTRVRAVFSNSRKGHILDISHFETVG